MKKKKHHFELILLTFVVWFYKIMFTKTNDYVYDMEENFNYNKHLGTKSH